MCEYKLILCNVHNKDFIDIKGFIICEITLKWFWNSKNSPWTVLEFHA